MTPAVRGALAALALVAGSAAAQYSLPVGPVSGCAVGNCAAANHGTYGPALFAQNRSQDGKHFPLAGPNEPGCVGRSSYPLSDWHYIRQFCGPTLQPGSCYGHFQTKWRRWDQICPGSPNPVQGTASPPPVGFSSGGPISVDEPKKDTLPEPKELPTEDPKKDEPKKDEPKKDPVAPPKLPLLPKEEKKEPLPVIPIPPVPELKVSANPQAAPKLAPVPATLPVVLPSTDLTPVVVVPPQLPK